LKVRVGSSLATVETPGIGLASTPSPPSSRLISNIVALRWEEEWCGFPWIFLDGKDWTSEERQGSKFIQCDGAKKQNIVGAWEENVRIVVKKTGPWGYCK
jgi:hypothetical protein